MAEQRLRLGDQNTADIKLYLIDSDGADYEGNPVYLHSQVLKKSEFYKTMLSDRWSSSGERPLELKVTSSHSFKRYIRCIGLMYSSQPDASLCFCFCNVDEALAILPIASQLLFYDCINECMRYFDAVRLNSVQEAQLRELISSLQINYSPDMAARLGMNRCMPANCEHLEALEEFLPEMLSMVSNGIENRHGLPRKTVEKYCVDYFTKANVFSAIAQKCEFALLKEFTANMGHIKCNDTTNSKNPFSVLLWLVGVIRRCDGKLFETVMKIFCEDVDFRAALSTNRFTYSVDNIKDIVKILVCRLLKGLSNGEIITPASFRIYFLTNWIETMVGLISRLVSERGKYIEMLGALEKGIVDLAETLPLVKQRYCVYKLWKEAFGKHKIYHPQCTAMQWWADHLYDAIMSGHSLAS